MSEYNFNILNETVKYRLYVDESAQKGANGMMGLREDIKTGETNYVVVDRKTEKVVEILGRFRKPSQTQR